MYEYLNKQLTEEQIEELMDLYYNSNMTVNKIKDRFDLNWMRSNQLYRYFPEKIREDIICKFCDQAMKEKAISRRSSQPEIYCEKCGHKEYIEFCDCKGCQNKRMAKELHDEFIKYNAIKSYIDETYRTPLEANSLTFKELVYLGTLLRVCVDHSYMFIHPAYLAKQKVSPRSQYTILMIKHLIERKIIHFYIEDDRYSLASYNVDTEKSHIAYDVLKTPYVLNINTNIGVFIDQLINQGISMEVNLDEVMDLWYEINYWECIELYEYRMESYGFRYSIGNETRSFFENSIQHLPISKIYSIIWNSARNSAAYYQEGKVGIQQAANSTLSRLRNTFDKYRAGRWKLYDYERPKMHQQSAISEYFHNLILASEDDYWFHVPSKEFVWKSKIIVKQL